AFLVGDGSMFQRFQNGSLSQGFIHHEYLFIIMNKYSLSYRPHPPCQGKTPPLPFLVIDPPGQPQKKLPATLKPGLASNPC
ncbi:MAG: hypothetical protein WB683_02645, partial [Candidatus Sulfotelmatobacter sp.]